MQLLLALSLFVLPPPVLFAAKVERIEGKPRLLSKTVEKDAKEGEKVMPGDRFRVPADGMVDLRFANDGLVRLHPGAELRVEKDEPDVVLHLEKGRIRALISKTENEMSKIKLEINTPEALVLVKGTEFTVDREGCLTTVHGLDGEVFVSGRGKKAKDLAEAGIFVRRGFRTSVSSCPGAGAAPVKAEKFELENLRKELNNDPVIIRSAPQKRKHLRARP